LFGQERRVALLLRPTLKLRWRGRFPRSAPVFAAALRQVEAAAEMVARIRWPRRLTAGTVADQSWRLLVGVGCVLIPAALMAFLSPELPVSTPGVALVVAVALSAYLAGWVGGVSALLLTAVVLDLLFVGDRSRLSAPGDAAEALGFGVTVVSGAALVWLIERIKRRSEEDRRAAVAARSAATALASLEAVAASQAPGDDEGRRRLFEAVVRALVGINRAHTGALYLGCEAGDQLTAVASYGFGSETGDDSPNARIGRALAQAVATERRPVQINDVLGDPRFASATAPGRGVRALVGVPIVGTGDRLLGVAMIGLLVRHRFSATEVAKLAALARQIAAIVDTASAADERETLLQRAREEQRRLELVISAMPEAVVLAAAPDGKVMAANDAAVALFGPVFDGEVSDLLRRIDGADCPIDDLPLTRALKTGEVAVGVELLARCPDGGEVPVLASAAPVREPDGSIVAVVAVFRDIAALKQAGRIKDEFVSVVSHELRSPLTPIRGFVQLVAKELDREGGHEAQVRRLRSIAGHVDRMTRLVDDLLDVSRLKAGSLDIRLGRTDLVALTREVVQVRAAAAAGHQVSFESPQADLVGDWDADRLHQIVDNLVGNAIKYSPFGGRVRVAVGIDHRSAEAVLTVADDGPGIPDEDRERIFTAFYRSRAAASSQVAGLGLGLYICHELVVAHGGRIAAGSSMSGGAEFTVRLPLAERSMAAA
jgi:PAS domain S-box-containing protein